MSATDRRQQIIRELRKIRGDVERLKQRFADRDALYIEARTLDPPLTHAELAEASGTGTEAVQQVFRRLRRQN